MPWEGGYVLQLWCDQDGCTARAEFVADSGKRAVGKANGAGWRVTHDGGNGEGRGLAFCPECRDINVRCWHPLFRSQR